MGGALTQVRCTREVNPRGRGRENSWSQFSETLAFLGLKLLDQKPWGTKDLMNHSADSARRLTILNFFRFRGLAKGTHVQIGHAGTHLPAHQRRQGDKHPKIGHTHVGECRPRHSTQLRPSSSHGWR